LNWLFAIKYFFTGIDTLRKCWALQWLLTIKHISTGTCPLRKRWAFQWWLQIDLGGGLRPVKSTDARLAEVAKLGIASAIIPQVGHLAGVITAADLWGMDCHSLARDQYQPNTFLSLRSQTLFCHPGVKHLFVAQESLTLQRHKAHWALAKQGAEKGKTGKAGGCDTQERLIPAKQLSMIVNIQDWRSWIRKEHLLWLLSSCCITVLWVHQEKPALECHLECHLVQLHTVAVFLHGPHIHDASAGSCKCGFPVPAILGSDDKPSEL
jgi:hypothetical protein